MRYPITNSVAPITGAYQAVNPSGSVSLTSSLFSASYLGYDIYSTGSFVATFTTNSIFSGSFGIGTAVSASISSGSYLSGSFGIGTAVSASISSGSYLSGSFKIGTVVTMSVSSGSYLSGSLGGIRYSSSLQGSTLSGSFNSASYFNGTFISSSKISGSFNSASYFKGTFISSSTFSGSFYSSSYFSGIFIISSSINGTLTSSAVISGSFISGTYNPSYITKLYAHWCPSLTKIDCSNNPLLSVVDIVGCTALTTLTMSNNVSGSILQNLTMSKNPLLLTMSFAYTRIPFTTLNTLFISTFSQSNALSGTLNITGSDTGSLQDYGIAAKNGLIARGWTIISGPNVAA